ncbi:hypothetical protein HOH45_04085 [bacterium]|jgi:hypothetical protein|nr:hypothetical protein [bacterium]
MKNIYKHKVVSSREGQFFNCDDLDEKTELVKFSAWLEAKELRYESPVFIPSYVNGEPLDAAIEFVMGLQKGKGTIRVFLAADGPKETRVLKQFDVKFPFSFPNSGDVSQKVDEGALEIERGWFETMFGFDKLRKEILDRLDATYKQETLQSSQTKKVDIPEVSAPDTKESRDEILLKTIDGHMLKQQKNMPLLLASLTLINSKISDDHRECARILNAILFASDSLFEDVDFPFSHDKTLTSKVVTIFQNALCGKGEKHFDLLNKAFIDGEASYEIAKIMAVGSLNMINDLMIKVRVIDSRNVAKSDYVKMEKRIQDSLSVYFEGQYNELHGDLINESLDDSAIGGSWVVLPPNGGLRTIASGDSLAELGSVANGNTSVKLEFPERGGNRSQVRRNLSPQPKTVFGLKVYETEKRRRHRARGVECVYVMALLANGISVTYNGIELPSLFDETIKFEALPMPLFTYFRILKSSFKILGQFNDLISSSREENEEYNKHRRGDLFSRNKLVSRDAGISRIINDLDGSISELLDIKKEFLVHYQGRISAAVSKGHDPKTIEPFNYDFKLTRETNELLKKIVKGGPKTDEDVEAYMRKEYDEFCKAIDDLFAWISGYTLSEIIILNGRNAQITTVGNDEDKSGHKTDGM